ncbi:peptide deformylase [Thermodesulfovibrio yellowstonii]|uniref:Peptide deformylase n=1 Tax=Thermodesulfovibrio yellowstonii (strain ATCC 51303 / DSM 11347 / YP87) TaxID=289376 RepID=DEF_THEYD|nr:peptide deformylase [Thermodesulfovibrio yellowstonii]B5YIL7.1 RecName: Full=Peptide deformylase; Short=PDF; AltName: Full=Polypeptide deformylase [Thermodesulfovibrio yellowstonii DSM 11347]ACI20745.1 peptide deformylase [Thermodesulfovibrio yellowstonii DSM 11347]
MAILEIKKYPDEVLKKKAETISEINGDLQKLIDNMIETMYNANGIGLAAPQVGVLKRLIVVDTSPREQNQSLIVLINPEITDSEGEILSEEGCLSLPGFTTRLKRKERVIVKGLDRNGKEIEIEATGLLARALQHEIDHLDGILLIDKISPLKRELFRKKFKTKK